MVKTTSELGPLNSTLLGSKAPLPLRSDMVGHKLEAFYLVPLWDRRLVRYYHSAYCVTVNLSLYEWLPMQINS